jgi:hypothetical protein
VDNLWSEQADVLRLYVEGHVDSDDVALELPTGSGKTLVGLLIAEWRRLKFEHTAAFVCPTNQLARQTWAKAQGYGIEAVLLIGPSEHWDQAEHNRVLRGEAIAITNYNHIFNRTPRLEPRTLVLDDSHTAEGPVSDRWSLKLSRDRFREAYMGALDAIGAELPPAYLRALRNEELDPVRRHHVEILLPDGTHRSNQALVNVLDPLMDGVDEWYAWDAIGTQIETCVIYATWSEILIRPFVAPTFTQEAFTGAEQRVYLSATMGSGGELERSFGKESIDRIPQPDTEDQGSSGRRYMIAPGAGRDGASANMLIQEIVEEVGRVLFLAPGEWRMNRAANVTIPDNVRRLYASDIENGLDPFTDLDSAALLLANRYDGIDLPDSQCELIVMSGLPTGTHLQERFLDQTLGARHALAERIRTRITQGVGRATRSRRDIAVVLLHGDDLINFLTPKEDRRMLRSKLQAELEIAFTTSELPGDQVLATINSFRARDEDWKSTEDYLRSFASENPQEDPPGADQLAAAAPHEIRAWREAWRGDYSSAVTEAIAVTAALNHPTMIAYRAWWFALAASWSNIASGVDSPQTVELTREAELNSRRLRWRPQLQASDGPNELDEDDALAIRADRAVQWLRGRYQSPKFERELTSLEAGIEETDATKFEMALQLLGEILGFQSERPANEEAAPDGVWQDGARAWIVWEAKSEEDPNGMIDAEETRQANSHIDWVKARYGWPDPDDALTVMVTPRTEVHNSVPGVASEYLHRINPSVVVEIARVTVELHRNLAGEIVGLNETEAIARMVEAIKAARLDTPAIIDQLSVESLREA